MTSAHCSCENQQECLAGEDKFSTRLHQNQHQQAACTNESITACVGLMHVMHKTAASTDVQSWAICCSFAEVARRQDIGLLPVRTQHRLRKTTAVQGALQEQRFHVAAYTPTRILPGQRLAHLAGSLRFAGMTAKRLDPSNPPATKHNWGSESAHPLAAGRVWRCAGVVVCIHGLRNRAGSSNVTA